MLTAGALLISLSVLSVLGHDPTVDDAASTLELVPLELATPEPAPVTEAPDSAPFSQCGISKSSRRIIGGERAAPGAHPWQVSLQYRFKGLDMEFRHTCGGILLSSCWVLTAAHCIRSTNEYQVVLGGLDIDEHEVMDQTIPVIQTFVHENYSRPNTENDIALLRLNVTDSSYCAEENRFVRAVCLPDQTFPAETECVISGWGTTENGTLSRHLLDAHIHLISDEKCKANEVYGKAIRTGMFCAGILEGGTDSCQGDSGGPLVCEQNGTHYITGVVSWGYGCARENKPGVYTDVYHFNSWIESKMKQTQDE